MTLLLYSVCFYLRKELRCVFVYWWCSVLYFYILIKITSFQFVMKMIMQILILC